MALVTPLVVAPEDFRGRGVFESPHVRKRSRCDDDGVSVEAEGRIGKTGGVYRFQGRLICYGDGVPSLRQTSIVRPRRPTMSDPFGLKAVASIGTSVGVPSPSAFQMRVVSSDALVRIRAPSALNTAWRIQPECPPRIRGSEAAINAPESCNALSCDCENASPIRVYGDAPKDTLGRPERRRHVSTGQHNRGYRLVLLQTRTVPSPLAVTALFGVPVRRKRAARYPKLMAPQYGA